MEIANKIYAIPNPSFSTIAIRVPKINIATEEIKLITLMLNSDIY